MKLLTYAFAFLLPLTAFAAEVGKPAPDFSTKDVNGVSLALEDLKDQILVLEWTNPECPFVKKHYGSNNMQNLQRYAKEKGVTWISINSSATGKQGHMNIAEAKMQFEKAPLIADHYVLDPEGTLGRLYGAKTTPHIFIINKGVLAYAGAIDERPTTDPQDIPGAKNYVRVGLDELLAGNPITTASTQAYGCSVKY